jgi:hypothetical protein
MDIYDVNKQIWMNSPKMKRAMDIIRRGGTHKPGLFLRLRIFWCKKVGHKWGYNRKPDINGRPNRCIRCGLFIGLGSQLRIW